MTESPWISVDDRLPDNGTFCLCATRSGEIIHAEFVKDSLEETWFNMGAWRISGITHWLPIPPVPKPAPQVTAGEWHVEECDGCFRVMSKQADRAVAQYIASEADAKLIVAVKEFAAYAECSQAYDGIDDYTSVLFRHGFTAEMDAEVFIENLRTKAMSKAGIEATKQP